MASFAAAIPVVEKSSDLTSIRPTEDDGHLQIPSLNEELERYSPVHLDSREEKKYTRMESKVQFERAIMEPGLTIAMVYYPYKCLTCMFTNNVLIKATENRPLINFISINYYDLEDIVGRNDVSPASTLFFFRDGKVVHRINGYDEEDIKRSVEKYYSS